MGERVDDKERTSDNERFARFEQIKAAYKELDNELLQKGRPAVHETAYGLWGTTNMNDCWLLFTRIKLARFTAFCDLGCGDGRVVAIASLFTNATGIEGEEALVEKGTATFSELDITAELKRKDYYDEDFSRYDLLFMFPDNRYDERMMVKLQKEFKGWLLVYNDIHRPPGITRGKTLWIEQLPIVTYPINIDEEDIEQ